MILELKETSVLAASMFSHAEIRPGEDGIICLELLDTIVSEGRREEILHYMDEVFCQRFQMDVSFNISYRDDTSKRAVSYFFKLASLASRLLIHCFACSYSS